MVRRERERGDGGANSKEQEGSQVDSEIQMIPVLGQFDLGFRIRVSTLDATRVTEDAMRVTAFQKKHYFSW